MENFSTCIEKNAIEVKNTEPLEVPPQPYWDPTLRISSSARMELMRALHAAGLIGFREGIKARASYFLSKGGAT